MLRRKYSLKDYNKLEAFKDATKFFIIYEGADKEPNYFQAFNDTFLDQKKAYIHHVLEVDTDIAGNMPENLRDRVIHFLKNPPKDLQVTPSKDDKFRFVLDVDKHPPAQILSLKEYSESLVDAHLYISNFCFEVWLWFHIDQQENITATKSKEMKTLLGEKQNEMRLGPYPFCYMTTEIITGAIDKAKAADIQKENYFPVEKSTKVYILIEELLKYSIENNSVTDPEVL
ncbi:RloB family protein [Flavobacterium sp. DGU11]|uniref:RloB family protein n=1 Tax=Flavobacterium arundinis TaxID=3139143 RepID=A0ABU9I2J9_9FLAO